MSDVFHRSEFEYDGEQFTVTYYYDPDAGAPWDNSDGHGPVRCALKEEKRAGEWVMGPTGSRDIWYLYDSTVAQAIALRDGWGHGDDVPGESPRQKAARAVRADFEYLRGWCTDEWHYIGIEVRHTATGETSALWCIDGSGSYAGADAYHIDVLKELARDIMASDAFAQYKRRPILAAALRTLAHNPHAMLTGAEILTLQTAAQLIEVTR